jgi:hypothetical protein
LQSAFATEAQKTRGDSTAIRRKRTTITQRFHSDNRKNNALIATIPLQFRKKMRNDFTVFVKRFRKEAQK